MTKFNLGDIKGIDGVGIKSFELLSTVGLVKTYRITLDDDTTFDIEITDGKTNTTYLPVSELPDEGQNGICYLIQVDVDGGYNVYDEYFWIEEDERFERHGTSRLNLDDYYTKDELDQAIQDAIDDLPEVELTYETVDGETGTLVFKGTDTPDTTS